MDDHGEGRSSLRRWLTSVIQLDTNFLIQATIAGSPAHGRVRQWAAAGEGLGVSTVAWAEYLCGPLDPKGEAVAKGMFPLPEGFSASDAVVAAELFNKTGRRSRSLADCMISAVAIRCGAKLATINTPDFQPFVQYGLALA
jgi:predicted nucleic acid-binding protein